MKLPLAGHGRRIAAVLLDFLYSSLLIGVFVVGGVFAGLAVSDDSAEDGWEELGWVLFSSFAGLIIGAAVWLALTLWLVRRPGPNNGQTLGKQTIGIRAALADGGEIGLGTALLREILAKAVLVTVTSSVISGLLGFFDVGLVGAVAAVCIWYGPAFFDDERRALHDRMCATRVVLAGRHSAPAQPASDEDLWAVRP